MLKDINVPIDSLNDALSRDPEAIRALFNIRVVCNSALADHPYVQVRDTGDESIVGLIGILNGIIEPLTGRRIAMCFTDDERTQLIGFAEYKEPVSC